MLTITFVQSSGTCEVTAVEGSTLMQTATDHGVEGIVAMCGGNLSCATCHVFIDPAWQSRVGAPNADEEELLELVPGRQPNSRLSCQVQLNSELDGLIVQVPDEQPGSG